MKKDIELTLIFVIVVAIICPFYFDKIILLAQKSIFYVVAIFFILILDFFLYILSGRLVDKFREANRTIDKIYFLAGIITLFIIVFGQMLWLYLPVLTEYVIKVEPLFRF